MSEQKIAAFLKQLRKTSRFSAGEVVEKLKEYNIEISAKTLYGYENKASMPNADIFVTLCKIYRCENPMSIFGDVTIDPDEISLIEKYRDLDDHGREMVDFTLKKEYERSITLKEEGKKDNIVEFEAHKIPKAANERTDIDVTTEQIEDDNNTMENPEGW